MRVFVCGATGFVGGHVVDASLRAGHEVTALVRDARAFRPRRGVRIVEGDIVDASAYAEAMRGCDASVNAVGLLRERWDKRGVNYSRVVVEGTRAWISAAKKAGIRRVVLVSANGARSDGTPYQRTKAEAERIVEASGLSWTILRPSLIFGPGGGDFVDAFRGILRIRVVPVFGRQDYRFEPVWIGDVTAVIVRSLAPRGRSGTIHIGGPESFTYRELLDAIRRADHRGALLVPAPRWAGLAVTALLGWLPFFPATLENMRLLLQGNACPDDEWRRRFQIEPRRFEEALSATSRATRAAP